jgi:hypothetical protein
MVKILPRIHQPERGGEESFRLRRASKTQQSKLLALMTKRVGVTLRLQRVNASSDQRAGWGNTWLLIVLVERAGDEQLLL